MKLSILIPTYNYNARELVVSMEALLDAERTEAEIFVGDDGSQVDMSWLDEVAQLPRVRVERFAENKGRAAHRNRMAGNARGEWLLFVDADARVGPDFSLKKYFEAAQKAPVVHGGLCHPEANPCPDATLRYLYERKADAHRSAAERSRHPYWHLTPFNLLVRRDIFLRIRFDEACQEYGYEDALFGVELEAQGIPILHIDNPLIHIGLESNAVFLDKSEAALRTLVSLNGRMRGHSHVENMAMRLRRWHLTGFVLACFKRFRGAMRRNLLSSSPNLHVFQLYKLGYYCSKRFPQS